MDFSSTITTTSLYILSLCMYLCLVVQFSPSFSINGDKEIVQCGRVRIGGVSKLNIQSYASAFRNASLGLCQCGNDNWKTIQNGQWNALMSPYQDRYVDVMFLDGVSAGSVKVSVEEQVRSEWAPFYYSSFIAVRVFLVVLVLVFQTMKLLPTSRKKAFYAGISLFVMGVGSFVANYFQMLVSSVLGSFGLREDMYYLVSICLLLGIVLVGATMGYWIMCKFVISDDGRVGVRVAQFVKWVMRTVAVTSILQSTLDVPFSLVRAKKVSPNHNCAKFLSREPHKRLCNTLRHSLLLGLYGYTLKHLINNLEYLNNVGGIHYIIITRRAKLRREEKLITWILDSRREKINFAEFSVWVCIERERDGTGVRNVEKFRSLSL
ncbi:hypothetical protein MKW94_003699 [Papaver nudicaule]|uniref:Uncharacterized protein n=1 Tax=Papaver nudicaule TaxID=74823 RepID=A0AA41VEB0_PAPNU|nr:hypothetical protein [Papaver nudicaule]